MPTVSRIEDSLEWSVLKQSLPVTKPVKIETSV